MSKKDTNHYIAVNPSGKEYDVKDIADFCNKHNLWPSNMRKVAQGKAKTCKGWLCRNAGQTGKITGKPKTKKRLDTRLQSQGAEYLVLGELLLERIAAYKAYENYPGYDIVALDENRNTSARIQVKSRYSTNHSGIIVRNLEFDFVVMVALNRGYSNGPKPNGDTGIKPQEYYVFPIDYIMNIRDPNSSWGRVTKTRMSNMSDYRDGWGLIRDFLSNR